MKKVLITGCSGYIGSHLTKKLESMGYELYGVDIENQIVRITNFFKMDITTRLSFQTDFDVVVHLAAKVNVGQSVKFPTQYYETNTFGTLNLLNQVKTKHFILASTGAAAGLTSPYGISKKAAEEIVEQQCKLRCIDYTIFRFYNVIGSDGIDPTNVDGLFYNLIKASKMGKFTLFGNDYKTKDGSCVRDYVHVNEICDAIKNAIIKPANKIENLGHGKGYTVKEIIDIFQKVNNVKFDTIIAPRREGDLESSVLDNPSSYMKQTYKIDQLLKL